VWDRDPNCDPSVSCVGFNTHEKGKVMDAEIREFLMEISLGKTVEEAELEYKMMKASGDANEELLGWIALKAATILKKATRALAKLGDEE
jgi:hypothetical protein